MLRLLREKLMIAQGSHLLSRWQSLFRGNRLWPGSAFHQQHSGDQFEALTTASARWWNYHMRATYVGDWHPAFPARYSGPESLDNHSLTAETVAVRFVPWRAVMAGGGISSWTVCFGRGLASTIPWALKPFPSAEAYKIGSRTGNICPARVFLRQTFGLGGDQEPVADDALHLGGRQDVSRITLTVGEISVLDIFDQNSYAGDPTIAVSELGLGRQRSLGLSGQQPGLHHRIRRRIEPAQVDGPLWLLPDAARPEWHGHQTNNTWMPGEW